VPFLTSHLFSLLNFGLDVPGLVVHVGRNPVHGLSLALVDVRLFQVVVTRFHDAVVDQQQDKHDSCDDGDHHGYDEEGIVPNGILCELVHVVIFDYVSPDEAQNVYD